MYACTVVYIYLCAISSVMDTWICNVRWRRKVYYHCCSPLSRIVIVWRTEMVGFRLNLRVWPYYSSPKGINLKLAVCLGRLAVSLVWRLFAERRRGTTMGGRNSGQEWAGAGWNGQGFKPTTYNYKVADCRLQIEFPHNGKFSYCLHEYAQRQCSVATQVSLAWEVEF